MILVLHIYQRMNVFIIGHNGEYIIRKGSEPSPYPATPNLIIFSGSRKPLQPLWIIYCVRRCVYLYSICSNLLSLNE